MLNWYNTRTLEPLHPAYISTVDSGNFLCCLTAFYEGLHDYAHEAAFTPLCERIKKLLDNTDMAILYNRRRKLFHLGYDLEKNEFSEIYYDLLMSEARLASYYAIAKKIVPKRHWGTLGRTLVKQNGYTGPVSWTGTMFEYLMPHLLLPVYKDSFTAEAIRFVLYCQKKRVQSHHVPWGISESGFYAFDAALNYQYEAHGVQKMALKRGMNGDLVISPYSTFLALPFDRTASLKNLHALKEYGLLGHCGFFEAIDFTSTRTNGRRAIIKSYMAHHVGMSIVACANASFDNIMQKRFMRNEQMRAANDLLKEKIPANAIVFKDIEKREIPQKPGNRTFTKESFEETSPVTPRAHVIANNDYTMVLTDCGASFSVFHGLDLTKRSHDLLRRPTGIFALAKAQGQILSATYAPFYTADPAYKQQTTFLTDGAIYRTNAENWGISMRACMHGNLPWEARPFEISNDTNRSLETNLLIYLEPLLSKTADEEAHPAFSRLFLQATYQADTRILLFTRRLRENESPIFLAIGFSKVAQPFHFELDRTALLERPQGISSLKNAFSVPFTDKTGAVPDIAAAMQLSLSVPAHKKESLTLLLAAGTTEKEAISSLLEARLEGFHNILRNAAGKNGNGIEARLSSLILPQILFPVGKNLLRSSAKKQNHMGQSGLWSLGISGDLPIIVFPFENTAGTERLEAYIRTHRTLKLDGILCDLVIIFHESGDYARSHTDNLHSILKNCGSDHLLDTSGGIHLVNLNFHSDTIRLLLFSCACHIASPENKSSFSPYIAAPLQNSNPVEKESPDFSFYAGGFTEKGVVIPHQEENPPAPWCHILAHQTFGTLVSDRALGFTWATNAHENKLTPWFNDPVYDNQGELLLLRLGGQIYNLCANAQVTFSNDRAIYKSQINGLLCTVTVCVPQNLLAKTVTLAIENRSKQAVQWEVAYYTEPVLGSSLSLRRHLALTCKDKAIFFKNAWAPVTGIGFLSTKQKSAILTNRAAFFSGNWIEEQTDSLDPCAALIQSGILVAEGTHTSIFALGWCASENAAFKMSQMALASAQNDPKSFMPLKQKRISVPVHAQMETATLPISQDNSYMMNYLPHSSDEIRIETVRASRNWLMRSLRHQFLGSRIFGRTGFYQCGGAWGFRDQLQDCTAALLLDPQITRAHILRCCAHQFDGGDVMHWWHQLPKKDGGTKGVRTRISDDLLWLPLVVADYLEKTDDTTLLHVPIAYLDGPQLKPGEKDHYFAPTPSDKIETVYQHCVQAIERATTHGAHGLPLFGAGDWNDGMNLVGAAGKGESVWLAMFLIYVLEQFSPICRKMHEDSRAEAYKQKAFSLRETVDAHCWDGNWYLRGFYDDGTPLGGKACDDCQIDILPQAFSSIAGFPDPNRRKVALDSMLQILADDRLRILKLFSPPFDHGTHNPGYIRAYPPGIRENGGQYTHAAVWGALGLLMDGRSDDAWRILQWINPIERSLQNKQAQQYRLEPYAIAGDISSNPTIEGRGGWSLYTGAAAWYYRVVLEYMLGIHIHAHNLNLRPLLPSDWDGYTAQLNLRGSKIDLRVQKGMDKGLTVDGQKMQTIPLDGNTHQVQFIF
ncbi:MAG TPA: hypothetical protein DEP42_01540 [Ruminococcaceae bacterium]|nr:hypothetical protein [Oscillospiraceae bacterium]